MKSTKGSAPRRRARADAPETDSVALLKTVFARKIEKGSIGGGDGARSMARKLLRERREIQKILTDRMKANRKEGERSLELLLLELDLGAMFFFDLVRVGKLRKEKSVSVFWEQAEKAPGLGAMLLENMLISLMNDLIALKMLLVHGMTGPAKTLLRAYLEKFYLCVAAAADQKVFEAYQDWMQEPDKSVSHWRKNLSPKAILQVVDVVFDRVGLPPTARSGLAAYRREHYAWLSGTSHAHPLAVLATVYTGGTRSNSRLLPALGGRHSGMNAELIEHLLYHNFEMFSVLLPVLHTTHGWKVPDGATKEEASDAVWTHTKWNVLQSLHIVSRTRPRARGPKRAA